MSLISAIVTVQGAPSMVRATAGSVTGSWGTAPLHAGDQLFAVVTAGGSTATAAAISTPAGWAQQQVISNTPTTANAWAAVYSRTAQGSDTAPTFTATLSGTVAMTCTLIEVAACDNANPCDSIGTYASGAGAITLSAMAVTATSQTYSPNEWAFAVFCQEAAAAANTWNGPGGAWSNLVNDGATSSVLHTAIDFQPGVAASATVTETGHWTTNATAFGAAIIVSVTSQSGGYEAFRNGASTTVSAGGTTVPAAGTPEFWTVGSWASFPSVTNTTHPQSLFHVSDPALPSETILVLNTSSGLVLRGADGTTPVAHTTGFTIQNVISSGYLNDLSPQTITVEPPTGIAATDSANIRAALNAAQAAGGAKVSLQPGVYQGDTGVFAIPQYSILFFQVGTQLVVNCTGGAAVDAITIANSASLWGEGQGGSSAIIWAGAGCNARTLVSNASHASQEWCYINGLSFYVNAGAVFAVALIEQICTNANSSIRDCNIDSDTSLTGVPALRLASESGTGMAPLAVEDSWIRNSGGDCILITDTGQAGPVQVWLRNCTVEHPASGFHNIHLSGTGGLQSVSMSGMHLENSIAHSTGGNSAFVYNDGCRSLLIEDTSMYSNTIASKVGVWITSSTWNRRVSIDQLQNITNVTPVIQDDTTTISYDGSSGQWVHKYNGPGKAGSYTGSFVLGNDLLLSSQTVALASTAVDARNGVIVDVTALAAAVVVAAPLNPQANQVLTYKFVQNGTGTWAVTWNAIFRVAAGVVSTTASKASVVGFRYDSTLTAWVQLWASTGV